LFPRQDSFQNERLMCLDVLNAKRQEIQGLLYDALRGAVAARELGIAEKDLPQASDIEVEVPREENHGDFASNLAMTLARAAKMAPRRIAEVVVSHLDRSHKDIKEVGVAGPGFINFHLTAGWFHSIIRDILNQGKDYGSCSAGKGESIQVEFVSANPTGPMNVVNARAAAVGDCLCNLLRMVGYDVGSEYYVNDAGNQADRFAASLRARFLQGQGVRASIPEDGYPGEYVVELVERLKRQYPGLPDMTDDELLEFFREHGLDAMVEWQKQDLKDFGVEFDNWFREKTLHAAGKVGRAVDCLRDHGYTYEEGGAVWFRSTEFGDDKDRVIVKSDGGYTYLAGDIAYHLDKFERGFAKVIDIWGPDHHGYVERTKAAIQALGYKADALEIMILQLVTLVRDGQPVRMSKRTGDFVSMDELVREVGKDAARYFFLMRSPESHLEFDINLAKEESNENPVYYVQYAHARICSILQQAAEHGYDVQMCAGGVDLSPLQEPGEISLVKKLAFFPEEVRMAALRREPHRIAYYVHELAGMFHSFYTQCRVVGEDQVLTTARLALVEAVQIVIRSSLELLGVSAPERM